MSQHALGRGLCVSLNALGRGVYPSMCWEGGLPGEVSAGGCLPMGVSAWGCLPRGLWPLEPEADTPPPALTEPCVFSADTNLAVFILMVYVNFI